MPGGNRVRIKVAPPSFVPGLESRPGADLLKRMVHALKDQYKNKKIGVLMGGLSPEREVSLKTGKAVFEAIQRRDLNVTVIDVDNQVAKSLEANKVDLAFIALHGTYGEDGTIQGLLEYMKIPYTGSGVLGSALAYNKVVSKEIFRQRGIPTADFQVFYKNQKEKIKRTLPLPVVAKPSDQGSSLGVTIVKTESAWEKAMETAFTYSKEVIVETYIEGKLLAIGMKGEQPMPIVHIVPKSGFYDYDAKYTPGKTEYLCPASLSPEETKRCGEVAKNAFLALKGRGVPRVDAILDSAGMPYILEMNTIPGMTPTSLLPMAAKQMGMSFDDLVMEILSTAQLDY